MSLQYYTLDLSAPNAAYKALLCLPRHLLRFYLRRCENAADRIASFANNRRIGFTTHRVVAIPQSRIPATALSRTSDFAAHRIVAFTFRRRIVSHGETPSLAVLRADVCVKNYTERRPQTHDYSQSANLRGGGDCGG